jgi:hypothetical protein
MQPPDSGKSSLVRNATTVAFDRDWDRRRPGCPRQNPRASRARIQIQIQIQPGLRAAPHLLNLQNRIPRRQTRRELDICGRRLWGRLLRRPTTGPRPDSRLRGCFRLYPSDGLAQCM